MTGGIEAEADYGEAIALARELGQSTELAASLAGLAWLEARASGSPTPAVSTRTRRSSWPDATTCT